MLAMLAGCAHYERAATNVDRGFNSAILDHEYKHALKAYDHEDYAIAATSFENLVDRLPESPEREEVLYKQGVAYFKLRNYHDADETFKNYLTRYPSGRFLADVTQEEARVAVERTKPNPVATELLDAAKKDLSTLTKLEAQHPTDPEVKYLLGNIQYELGHYEQAGQKYLEAQSLQAAYMEKDLIRERMFINNQGQPVVLTPADLDKLDRERHPLVIFDAYPFRSRNNTDAFGAQQVYKVVTGKIRNQGSKVLHNVSIDVRFVNAVSDILDVQVVQIGRLYPNEVKAFLARAENYDSLLNIVRVEYVPRAE